MMCVQWMAAEGFNSLRDSSVGFLSIVKLFDIFDPIQHFIPSPSFVCKQTVNLYILLILEFLFPIKRFGDDFGESFIRKDAHCFLQLRVKLRVFKAVLKRHLVVVYADWWGYGFIDGVVL